MEYRNGSGESLRLLQAVQLRLQFAVFVECLDYRDVRDIFRFWLHQLVRYAPGAPLKRIGIAEEAKNRLAERGGHMHRPSVAADDLFANGQSGEEIRKCMGRKRHDWKVPELFQNLMCLGIVTG